MKNPKSTLAKVWSITWKVLLAIIIMIIALMALGTYTIRQSIEHIKETRLTMQDVTGETLPPKRTRVEYDKTVEGLDENNNGIRDDVEHAIFEMEGDSLQMRAAKLQMVQAKQLWLDGTVFDGETNEIAAGKSGHATRCMWHTADRDGLTEFDQFDIEDEIDALTKNTEARKKLARKNGFLYTPLRVEPLPDEECHVEFNNGDE